MRKNNWTNLNRKTPEHKGNIERLSATRCKKQAGFPWNLQEINR